MSLEDKLRAMLKADDIEISEHTLLTFTSNVRVILAGGRLAYGADICDRKLNKFLVNSVLHLESRLSSVNFQSGDSLIILSDRRKELLNILNEEKDGDVFVGKALGYAYNGKNWMGTCNDVYTISYTLTRNSTFSFLYSFNVPIDEYNDDIKNKIRDDLTKYQTILDDCEVKVASFSYNK